MVVDWSPVARPARCLCAAGLHQLCAPEGGSSHGAGDVTPATSAEIGVVPVSNAYGSSLHHAVFSENSLVCPLF